MKLDNLVLLSLLVLFTQAGCGVSNDFFSANSSSAPQPSAQPSPQTSNNCVKTIQPAVAVKGMSCLMCHAKIQSNVITDFGKGEAWFMGGANTEFSGTSWYNDYAFSWQSSQLIQGQLYVPDTQVQSGLTVNGAPVSSSMKVADMITTNYSTGPNNEPGSSSSWFDPYGDRIYSTVNQSVAVNFVPPSGQPQVVAKQNVLIRAPSPSEILSLVPKFAANPNLVDFQQVTLSPSSKQGATNPTANFVVIGSGKSQAVTNPSGKSLNCYGDVVINGPLFLNQAKISTDSNGCRLYVNGTVFIQGGIRYGSNSGCGCSKSEQSSMPAVGSNLQISSSRGVFMGIGSMPNSGYSNGFIYPEYLSSDSPLYGMSTATLQSTISPLQWRLFGDVRNAQLHDYNSSSGSKDWYDFAKIIWNDALIVTTANNSTQLIDAQDSSSPGFDSTQKRASIQYTGLLLNAPVVESRYQGSFQGVVVSELALFAVGNFNFTYDPVFKTAPILPLLSTDILNVQ